MEDKEDKEIDKLWKEGKISRYTLERKIEEEIKHICTVGVSESAKPYFKICVSSRLFEIYLYLHVKIAKAVAKKYSKPDFEILLKKVDASRPSEKAWSREKYVWEATITARTFEELIEKIEFFFGKKLPKIQQEYKELKKLVEQELTLSRSKDEDRIIKNLLRQRTIQTQLPLS